MKKFYYVILLCNIFFEYSFAQAIDFSKLSLGLGGNYYITSDDMKEYWGNFPAATIRIKYSLRKKF